MEIWAILIGIMVVIVLYIIIKYNKLVRGKAHVEQAKSGIDIYLKQRFDLIPNLVECVKKYCEHEESIFTEIASLRKSYEENKDLETGSTLNGKFNGLIAIAENYPRLKADEQFLMLQKSLTKMESQLQAARRLYNMEVTNLNNNIAMFPGNLVARVFNFKQEKLFELENENERENINIEFK